VLKVWLGKDGGSVIISKSDSQHYMMQELGFKMVVGLHYTSMHRVDPGDYCIYRALDYLGNDSIYRCMRINDDTDTKYIELKKDKYFKSKLKQQKKLVLSLNDVLDVDENDRGYMACAACKRTFRIGNNNRHQYYVTVHNDVTNTDIEWGFKSIGCCDKFYTVGENPALPGRLLVFCTGTRVAKYGAFKTTPMSDDEKLLAAYLSGRKEAIPIERIGE